MKKAVDKRTSLKTTPKSLLRQEKGQLILEYVLLISVVVVVAASLSRLLVSRNEDNPGVIINKWVQFLNLVGQDMGD